MVVLEAIDLLLPLLPRDLWDRYREEDFLDLLVSETKD